MSLLSLYTITYIITGLIGLVLMIVVLHRNWNDRFSVLYALVNISLFVWATGRYLSLITTNHDVALFWIRILYYGSVLIYIFFIHSILTFIRVSGKRKIILLFFNSLAVILLIANTTDLIFSTKFLISDAGPKLLFPFYEIPGRIYFVQLFINIAIPLYALFELLMAYRYAEGKFRSQIKYIILSSIFGFVGGGTILLPVYGFNIQPFGIPFVALQFITITYAITRHRLFDLKIIATQVFTFTLWIFIFIRTLLSDNPTDIITNASLLVLTVAIGVFLIKSVMKEVSQREKIEKLAVDLSASNKQLVIAKEKEIQHSKEVEEFNRNQEGLIHLISHEVKSGLSKAIDVFAEIVEGTYDSDQRRLKEDAGVALKDDRKVVEQVEDVLNSANFKTGKMVYDIQPFDFKEALVESVNKYKPEAEARGLKLEVKIKEGEDYTIKGDHKLIVGHLFKNLFENAISFTPSGSIVIDLSKRDKEIKLSVRDTGVGITPEDKEVLFTEGGHGKDSRKVNVHSTGFGLFITKQVVLAHHGKIWAESEGAGKGSTFFVELPGNSNIQNKQA